MEVKEWRVTGTAKTSVGCEAVPRAVLAVLPRRERPRHGRKQWKRRNTNRAS